MEYLAKGVRCLGDGGNAGVAGQLNVFGVRIAGMHAGAAGASGGYRGNFECPLIQDVDQEFPLFAGLERGKKETYIATNRPSFFTQLSHRVPVPAHNEPGKSRGIKACPADMSAVFCLIRHSPGCAAPPTSSPSC